MFFNGVMSTGLSVFQIHQRKAASGNPIRFCVYVCVYYEMISLMAWFE